MEIGGTKKKNARKWSDLAITISQELERKNMELDSSEKSKINADPSIPGEEELDGLLKNMIEGVAASTIADLVTENDEDLDPTSKVDAEKVIAKIMEDLEKVVAIKSTIKQKQVEMDLQSAPSTSAQGSSIMDESFRQNAVD